MVLQESLSLLRLSFFSRIKPHIPYAVPTKNTGSNWIPLFRITENERVLVTNDRGTPRRAPKPPGPPGPTQTTTGRWSRTCFWGSWNHFFQAFCCEVVDIPFFCCTRKAPGLNYIFLGWSKLKH